MIKIRKPFGNDWVRYWPVDRIMLDNNSKIKNESQLAYYIYKKHGQGRFQILAWQKGYEGFWLYWLGDIMQNGFIRDKNKNKELDKLKFEFNKAGTFEEKSDIEEEMSMEREINELDLKTKRRGPLGIAKLRPGILHPYEEF